MKTDLAPELADLRAYIASREAGDHMASFRMDSLRAVVAAYDAQGERIAELESALKEIDWLVDGEEDADGWPPVPNTAMRVRMEVQKVLPSLALSQSNPEEKEDG